MPMKLCIVGYFSLDYRDGNWHVDKRAGNLVDSLASYFECIRLVGPTFDSSYVSRSSDNQLHEYVIKSPNVTCIPLKSSTPLTPLFRKTIVAFNRIPQTFSAIKQSDFTYITFPGYSGFLAHLLCRILGRPYALYFGSDWQEVARFQANWQDFNNWLYKLYVRLSKWAERFAVQGSSFTVAHGKKVVDKFSDLNVPVVNTMPMVLIKEPDFFYRDDTCQDETITCIYVGTFIARKGVHTLIDACSLLRQEGASVRLCLVGAGDRAYVASLKEQIAQHGITENVEFVEFTNDLGELLALYRQADIFVLPTQGEGFPRVIYEAMSQGLPVIASKIGTLASELADQEQAVLVEPSSASCFASAIRLVMKDAKLRRKLIQNGYRFTSARLTHDSTATQLVSLIKQYVG